jgi:hypothetical protein
MARNGLKAVEEQPANAAYDALPQEGQDAWDEIGKLGYRPERSVHGMWFAHKINGTDADAIGPAGAVVELLGSVQQFVATQPAADGQAGEVRLPGMEEPEIDELNTLGDECIFAKEKRDKAKTEFEDSCDIMRQKMREHGRKRYHRRGFSLVIEDSEKLVIKKAENVKKPKNPKAALTKKSA